MKTRNLLKSKVCNKYLELGLTGVSCREFSSGFFICSHVVKGQFSKYVVRYGHYESSISESVE